jgi:anti-anti-sigma factor
VLDDLDVHLLSITTSGLTDSPVVHLSGELDISGRAALATTWTAFDHDAVAVDLSALHFMDCAGYGGLVAARLALESRGGSLTLLGSDGEPKRLLDLIAETEGRLVAVPA